MNPNESYETVEKDGLDLALMDAGEQEMPSAVRKGTVNGQSAVLGRERLAAINQDQTCIQ